MTEQDFQKQVWRPYDKITTADGVPGKVLQVAFNTKCVRAYISGAPEWIKCDLIETHTTGRGGDADDMAIIEDLHNKLLAAQDKIVGLKTERDQLRERVSGNHFAEILRAINMIKEGLTEKKNKIAKIDSGLSQVENWLAKIEDTNP